MIFDMGCSKVEVESDCLELMDACNGKMDIRGPNSSLLADCFHLAHMVLHQSLSITVPGKQTGWHTFWLGLVSSLRLVMFG